MLTQFLFYVYDGILFQLLHIINTIWNYLYKIINLLVSYFQILKLANSFIILSTKPFIKKIMNSLNKKQTRKNLIRYFKAIAKAQKYTQKIQDQIVSHVRFNPISLYKKISHNKPQMKGTDLKTYLIKTIKIQRSEGIKLYFLKNGITTEGQISLQEFIETLIPYTPNILRQANQNIVKQMETNHVDITVEDLYKKLISVQTDNLYLIRLLQRQVNLTWNQIRAFIDEDIQECGKRIDLTIKQDTDVIYVRKWMELWTKVDQYQVLNMMRFFKGGSQAQIHRIYQNKVSIIMKCTCQLVAHREAPQQLPSQRSKSKSKRTQHQQQNSIRNDTFQQTLQNHQEQSFVNQLKFQTQHQKIKTQHVNQQDNSSSFASETLILKNFLLYIETLLSNQKIIQHHRALLKPYKKDVEQILHDLTSKKKPHTRLQKILLYIQKIVDLKEKQMERLLKKVGDIKVQNHIIFTIFSPDLVSKLKTKKKPSSLSPKQIIFSIGTILEVFIQTKAKLIQLSQILVNNCQQILKQILITTSKTTNTNSKTKQKQKQKQKQKISAKELSNFMKQFNLVYSQKEYMILMSHFGDSSSHITRNSLNKVFLIQTGYSKQRQK